MGQRDKQMQMVRENHVAPKRRIHEQDHSQDEADVGKCSRLRNKLDCVGK